MDEHLLKAVENRREQMVDLTVDLVKFPTINPPGEAYMPCAEYLGSFLERHGFHTQLIRAEGTPGDSDRHPRTNMVARYEGRGPGPTVHFNGHIDVVEAGRGWTFDPFAGTVADGKIYGRGTCDMKGGLASAIVAALAFIACYPQFCGAIEISGTVDEESGGFGGVAFLAEKGFFSKPRVDHVIIPEPLNKDRICLGHRGVWWAQIETHGRIAHGSMPFLGDCAVRHMAAVMQAFEQSLFPALAQRSTVMPVVPDAARASTLNLNSIHGGEFEGHSGLPAPNVPDSCRMVIDRRFVLEEPLSQVKQEVVDILDHLTRTRSNFSYQISDLMEVLPSLTDRHAPVPESLDKAISHILGRMPEYVVSPGTYDQKHINRIGHLHDCVAYGPGILDLAHQPDEWVDIADMVQSAQVMALSLWQLFDCASH